MRLSSVTESAGFDLDEAKIFINMRIKPDQFEPVLSAKNVDLHFNTLTKGYFKKWNETKTDFAFCGAALHSIWWANLAKSETPLPKSVEEFLEPLGLSVDNLAEKFIEKMGELEGNGWLFMDRSGSINIIPNHSHETSFNDILLLVDLWEHSYILDYQADKETYVRKVLTLIDWKEVGKRLTNPQYAEQTLRISR